MCGVLTPFHYLSTICHSWVCMHICKYFWSLTNCIDEITGQSYWKFIKKTKGQSDKKFIEKIKKQSDQNWFPKQSQSNQRKGILGLTAC